MNYRIHACFATAWLAACASNGGSLPGQDASTGASTQPATSSYAYSVVDLGTLGGSFSGASSINNDDWVSGMSTLASGTYLHAALWKDGGAAMDLGTLGGPNSAVEWPVKNDHGLISGISETSQPQKLGEVWSCAAAFFPQPPSGHICRGFAWKDGKMFKLPTLGGNNGFGAGANDRGKIVGWAETRKHDPTCTSPQVLGFEAVIYDTNRRKIQELPPYRHDKDGAATEINDRDQVVGISGKCDQAVGRFTAHHAVMWDNGRIINLGNLGGVAWNTPMALDEKGNEVVGFADLPGDQNGTPNPVAFLWTRKTGMQNLGTLPGDTNSEAYGINDLGQIVGVSFNTTTGASRAFLWQNGTMTDLNTLIPPSSGLYLLYANDINDSGVIAGGACVVVSGSCGSETPAYMATPTGNSNRTRGMSATSSFRPPALSKAVIHMLRYRPLLP